MLLHFLTTTIPQSTISTATINSYGSYRNEGWLIVALPSISDTFFVGVGLLLFSVARRLPLLVANGYKDDQFADMLDECNTIMLCKDDDVHERDEDKIRLVPNCGLFN